MSRDDSEPIRLALAYLRARAAEDHEALDVLTRHADLEDLAEHLADMALLFISAMGDNPIQHLELMFRAVGIGEATT